LLIAAAALSCLSGAALGQTLRSYALTPESLVQQGIAHGTLNGPFEF